MKALRMIWAVGLVAAFVVLSLLLGGCGGGSSDGGVTTTGSSTLLRNVSPVSSATTQTSLVSGVNATGVSLLQHDPDSNAVVAPYSASLALAMLRNGAAGSTRSSLDDFLHLSAVTEDVDAAFNKLDLGLKGRLETAGGASLQSVVGWSQNGYGLRRSFLDALAVNYGLTTGQTDFAHNLSGAWAAQNSWLQQWPAATNFTVGSANTKLVLGSGMKVSLAWQDPFNPALTAPGLFQLLNNSTETVPFLHQTASIKTATGDGYLAIGLPLAAGQEFLIVMPDQDKFTQVSGTMTADRWQLIAQSLAPTLVDLALPVFSKRYGCSIDLGGGYSCLFGGFLRDKRHQEPLRQRNQALSLPDHRCRRPCRAN